MLEARGNLSGLKEIRSTLRLRQLSPFLERNGCFSGNRCTTCGSDSHNTHDKYCPVRGVQPGRSCGKANHFAKWCRSEPAAVKHVAQDSKKDAKEPVTVFSLRSETNETGRRYCQVNEQDVELDLLIDLGVYHRG